MDKKTVETQEPVKLVKCKEDSAGAEAGQMVDSTYTYQLVVGTKMVAEISYSSFEHYEIGIDLSISFSKGAVVEINLGQVG